MCIGPLYIHIHYNLGKVDTDVEAMSHLHKGELLVTTMGSPSLGVVRFDETDGVVVSWDQSTGWEWRKISINTLIEHGKLYKPRKGNLDAKYRNWIGRCIQGKGTGIICKKCKEYNEYAAPNLPNGTFVCFKCR